MFLQYREIRRNEKIVVGADCSMGLHDYSVAQFISRTELDVPLVYRDQCIASEMTNRLFPILEQICDKTGYRPLVAFERQNGGIFEMERLAHLNRNNKFRIYQMKRHGDVDDNTGEVETIKLGWDTTSASRPAMLIALKEAIDTGLIRVYDKTTIEEMLSFVKVRTSTIVKAQAERNCYDDCVMALAIAWQLYLDAGSDADEDTVSEAMQQYLSKIEHKAYGKAGY